MPKHVPGTRNVTREAPPLEDERAPADRDAGIEAGRGVEPHQELDWLDSRRGHRP